MQAFGFFSSTRNFESFMSHLKRGEAGLACTAARLLPEVISYVLQAAEIPS